MSESIAAPETRTEAAEEMADRYLAVWNEPDADRRTRTIGELWTQDARHFVQPPQRSARSRRNPGSG